LLIRQRTQRRNEFTPSLWMHTRRREIIVRQFGDDRVIVIAGNFFQRLYQCCRRCRNERRLENSDPARARI
jgi:hypothetical protein